MNKNRCQMDHNNNINYHTSITEKWKKIIVKLAPTVQDKCMLCNMCVWEHMDSKDTSLID